MTITMEQREYVEERGFLCPVCGSFEIEPIGRFNDEDGQAWRLITCRECGAQWEDLYQLTGYVLKSEPNRGATAAAPELLEALQALLDHAQEQYPHFESERGQTDIARAKWAIAKATGK